MARRQLKRNCRQPRRHCLRPADLVSWHHLNAMLWCNMVCCRCWRRIMGGKLLELLPTPATATATTKSVLSVAFVVSLGQQLRETTTTTTTAAAACRVHTSLPAWSCQTCAGHHAKLINNSKSRLVQASNSYPCEPELSPHCHCKWL